MLGELPISRPKPALRGFFVCASLNRITGYLDMQTDQSAPLGVQSSMSSSAPLDRDIGRHDAQIEGLQQEMAMLREDVHAIKLMLASAQGGWKMLMAVGGISGVLGALAHKALAAVGIHGP